MTTLSGSSHRDCYFVVPVAASLDFTLPPLLAKDTEVKLDAQHTVKHSVKTEQGKPRRTRVNLCVPSAEDSFLNTRGSLRKLYGAAGVADSQILRA